MIKHPIFLLALLLVSLACAAQKKTQQIKFPFSDQIKEKYEVYQSKDGSFLKDGYYKKWYPDGQIEINCSYSKNKLNGPYKSFYSNAKPKSEANYRADSLHGYVIDYNINGNRIWEGSFADNKKQGVFKYYYFLSNGKLAREGRFENNIKVGIWTRYNSDGAVDRIYKYDNNGQDRAIEGKWRAGENIIEYFSDGKFLITDKDNNKIREGSYSVELEERNVDKLILQDPDNRTETYVIDSLVENEYTIRTYNKYGIGNTEIFNAVKIP